MKKIDRYILSKFLVSFFYSILLLTVIIVVIDISEKTDDFVKAKLPAWQIITEYYFGFIPRIDAMLFPLFVFIAVIFFTAKMAHNSEIVAILSSGISFPRFLVPYWIGGIFLSIILWLSNQYIIPRANVLFGNFSTRYLDANFGPQGSNIIKPNVYFRIDSQTYAGMKYYDTTARRGDNFFIQKFKGGELSYNLRADYIMWDTAAKKWQLNRVLERFLEPSGEQEKRSATMLMNYNFKPVDLQRDEYLKDRLSTKALSQYIRDEEMRGSEILGALKVELYNRNAIPFSVIILTIIGVVLSSRKVRGGSGFHLAVGVILSCAYVLFSRFSIVFAMKGDFPPLLASWMPNIIFGAVAFYLYKRAPK